ncbi:hypothetical protein C8J56DRAFT_19320 [Mycena floridula]|nr:hypothetical protein C8J56DRAFT_19320 [Mycena floridula]
MIRDVDYRQYVPGLEPENRKPEAPVEAFSDIISLAKRPYPLDLSDDPWKDDDAPQRHPNGMRAPFSAPAVIITSESALPLSAKPIPPRLRTSSLPLRSPISSLNSGLSYATTPMQQQRLEVIVEVDSESARSSSVMSRGRNLKDAGSNRSSPITDPRRRRSRSRLRQQLDRPKRRSYQRRSPPAGPRPPGIILRPQVHVRTSIPTSLSVSSSSTSATTPSPVSSRACCIVPYASSELAATDTYSFTQFRLAHPFHVEGPCDIHEVHVLWIFRLYFL